MLDYKEIFNKKSIAVLCICAILISTIIFLVQLPGLSANAKLMDDDMYLTHNRLVKNPSVESAKTFLTEVLRPSTVAGYYQPLAMISLMCDYWMGGSDNNRVVFHTTSLILHIFNSCLIMFFLYILFKNIYVAALTALMFGVHPMTVETIAWVGERKTTLATFFSLLCMIAYILYTERRKKSLYIVCVTLYVLALMSKPTSTMVPIALLLLDFWPLGRIDMKSSERVKNILSQIIEKIPFFVISLISAVITYVSQKNTAMATTPGEVYPPIATVWRICYNIVFYPIKMIYPINLSSHYPIPDPLSLNNVKVLLAVVGSIIFIALLIISLKRTRALLVGFSIFFILTLPTMGIIGFTNTIASDKYAYLSVIGFLLIVAKILSLLWDKQYGYAQILPIVIVSIIIVICSGESYVTRDYISYWQNTEKIYQRMISLAPKASLLYQGLGIDYYERGNLNEATKLYKKAISLDPKNIDAYNNLGAVFVKKGNQAQAIECFRKALNLRPTNSGAYNNLAIALRNGGNIDEAMTNFKKAVELNPRYEEAWGNIANLLLKDKKDPDAAVDAYKKAISLNPRYIDAYNSVGIILKNRGNIDEAIQWYKNAIAKNPDATVLYRNYGAFLLEKGRTVEAVEAFRKVLELNPNDMQIKEFLKRY